MDKVSIVTPVFGKSDLTSEFIMSVANYIGDNELIIVDNNSPDNTLSILRIAKKLYPTLNLKIFSGYKNVGFGTANNIGVKLASNDIIIFISNDVKILGDFITPIQKVLEGNPRLAVGPRFINHNTGWNTFDRFGTIQYLEGFCFALYKSAFQMVGGFDENIFIDYEDIELSLRLHLAGVGLGQISLPVMHQLGGSFSGLPKARLEYTLASLAYVSEKWQMKKENSDG